MTKYEEKISKINKYKAWKYFETKYPCLKMIRSISKYSIVLHHKDPSWRKEEKENLGLIPRFLN